MRSTLDTCPVPRLLTRAALVVLVVLAGTQASQAADPREVWQRLCATCHESGINGAPRVGDAAEWQRRLAEGGEPGLVRNAIRGSVGMPPRGGDLGLSDDDVRATVRYVLSLVRARAAASSAPVAAAPSAAAIPADTSRPAPAPSAPVARSPVTSTAPPNASAPTPVRAAADPARGRAVYQSACAACHGTGAAGAPKLGDASAWTSRLAQGTAALHANALKGKGAMPPKGGQAQLADADVTAAVDYLIAQSRGPGGEPRAAAGDAPKAAAAGARAAEPADARGQPVSAAAGRSIYQSACAACHASGAAGAPRLGDVAAWQLRLRAGVAGLYASALGGKGAMPAKGGQTQLADAQVRAAVDFMLAQARASGVADTSGAAGRPTSPGAPPPAAAAAAPTGAAPPSPSAATAAAPTSVTAPSASAPPRAAAPAAGTPAGAAADVNAFNRLLRAPGRRNLSPMEDGIHDPSNDGTAQLQPPLQAFAPLPKSNAGNRIDWVRALNDKLISPRAERSGAPAEMAVLDLNIVREVKGSMPDVVYPHRQHTQWLDCSNCHPSIFIPQKGANQISMASIMLGEKCGVCHGRVAFPISECRLCHSRAKDAAATNPASGARQ